MKKLKQHVSQIELFSQLNEEELDYIIEYFEILKKKKGEFLFKEGQDRQGLTIIKQGHVELIAGGTELDNVVSSFFPGDFLGEGALLEDYPHSTSAFVTEDSEVIFFKKGDFDKIMEEKPKTASKILASISKIISRRLRKVTTQMLGSAAQYLSGKTRLEHDLLGEKNVPAEAYYGIQTLRAKENFPITNMPISHYTDLIIALAQIKQASARSNRDVGLMDNTISDAIDQACEQIIHYKYHVHFVVDIFQGGAGTSTNMNANEVIANRALEILGYEKGRYDKIHPNNHVNLSQSTNDVYPTSLKLAAYYKNVRLMKELELISDSFDTKGKEFSDVIKMGRTQLQDAVPMTLGQEFGAYGATLREEINKLKNNSQFLLEMNLGGTAIGTGINTDRRYAKLAVWHMQEITGLPVKNAENLVEATQDTGVFVLYSSLIKRLAIKLSKICNDLRLLSSGPRAGFNEINLPPRQPGSSIMPGKVNPVIPEVVNQVCYNVIGNDLTITMASEAGQLQLNVMEPVIAQSLFEMMDTMTNSIKVLRTRCIDGIKANRDVCRSHVENSIGIVTALNPHIGYEASSAIAKEALASGKSVYQCALEQNVLPKEKLDELLAPERMI
jgi:aspartate ammonia-lyase